MKKYWALIMIVALGLFAGCRKSEVEKPTDASVVGEWRLDAWGSEAVTEFSVYLKLDAKGRFELYQQLEHGFYDRFDGEYRADKGVLTGTYDDGEPWAVYDYVLEGGGDRLVLTARDGDRLHSIYVRTPIPEDIVIRK